MSLTGSQKKLRMGESGFFFTCELYENDHVQREKDIRDIILFFKQRNTPLLFIKIEGKQDWGNLIPDNIHDFAISEDEMINTLDSSAGLYE
ncbi:hypothetical protein [Pseudomonas brassicacearum]|nr:hypothetical protein [Pseudomonas brassicacearum]